MYARKKTPGITASAISNVSPLFILSRVNNDSGIQAGLKSIEH